MTLVLGLVKNICREVSEKCQFGCSVPTCDGHTPSSQPNKNQLYIRKRACLSVWWGHHRRKYEAVMKIKSTVSKFQATVWLCTYKSNVYRNIKYFKYIFLYSLFLNNIFLAY